MTEDEYLASVRSLASLIKDAAFAIPPMNEHTPKIASLAIQLETATIQREVARWRKQAPFPYCPAHGFTHPCEGCAAEVNEINGKGRANLD